MIIENEKELLKLLVMAKGFCEEQSCGLCHDALSRSEAIVIKQIITAAPVQQTTSPTMAAFKWFENLVDTWHIYTDEQKLSHVKSGIERLNGLLKLDGEKQPTA